MAVEQSPAGRPAADAAGETIGILPLGRTTFDVAFAESKLSAMLAALDRSGRRIVGPRTLLTDADAGRVAIAALKAEAPHQVLILQVTFTDAALTAETAAAFDQPLSIWAVPEPRLGGRLRLNAFCGLNLASHALGLRQREFSWLYADPQAASIDDDLAALLSGRRRAGHLDGAAAAGEAERGKAALAALAGRRIGRIGVHPDGFDTCRYDAEKLEALAGIAVEEIALDHLFTEARAVDDETVRRLHSAVGATMQGLEAVDQEQLDRSLKLKAALDGIRDAGGYDAFAIRCWPETFTDYGGAVCGPVAMMGEARVPCACEADVYGALTQLLLQEVADQPVFLVDLVDMDRTDDSGVVWHCGQAPASMADAEAAIEATIHSNRKMPLLYQFPLKPGRVTFARISQARGREKLVIGGGEMLKRPMAFTGTSGVIRFDGGTETALKRLIDAGVEHHMALAYGDHRAALEDFAAAAGLPIVHLSGPL